MVTLMLMWFLLCGAAGRVVDLSGYQVDEFKSELENYDSIFIKFYAPYCGHCKSMAQDFISASKTLQDDDSPILLAEVDCTSATGTKVCAKYNIRGYPSLKLFKHGTPFKDYEGERKSKDLVEWLKKHAKDFSKRSPSFSELNQDITKADGPVVVGIFHDLNDEYLEMWFKAAKKVKEHWHFRDVQVRNET